MIDVDTDWLSFPQLGMRLAIIHGRDFDQVNSLRTLMVLEGNQGLVWWDKLDSFNRCTTIEI